MSQGIAWTTVENGLQAWVVAGTGLPGTSVIWWGQNKGRPQRPFITLQMGPIRQIGLDWINYVDTPYAFGAKTLVGVASSVLNIPAHGLAQGDGPIQVTSTGTLPSGLTAVTNYWVIPVDADHLKLAATFLDAWAPTPVAVTSSGTGTVTLVSVAATRKAGAELTAKTRGMRTASLSVQAFIDPSDVTGSPSAVAMLDAVVARWPRQRSALKTAGIGINRCGQIRPMGGVIDTSVFEPRAVLDVTLSLASEVQDPDTYIERAHVTPTVDGVDQPVQTITLDE